MRESEGELCQYWQARDFLYLPGPLSPANNLTWRTIKVKQDTRFYEDYR
jgi:hypothetical protein